MDGARSDAGRFLPDFLIIGAAKSGTTSLYFYLRQHPSLFLPPETKEPGFLCFSGMARPAANPAAPLPDLWQTAVLDPGTYAALFATAAAHQVIGEATPEYLYLADETIATIRARLQPGRAGPKMIAVLRNPIERLWSHYSMGRRDHYEDLPVEQAVDPAVIRRRREAGWHPQYDYLGYGLYARSIRVYREAFGADRLKVFLFEDLKDSPAATCNQIFDFLGVDPAFKTDTSIAYNVSGKTRHPGIHRWLFVRQGWMKKLARAVIPYDRLQRMKARILAWNSEKSQMSEDLRRNLQEFYRKDIGELEQLLGRNLSGWLR